MFVGNRTATLKQIANTSQLDKSRRGSVGDRSAQALHALAPLQSSLTNARVHIRITVRD